MATGQLPAKFRESLERMAKQSGQSHDYVTPNYDKILASYQPAPSKGGGGLSLGSLKSLGGNALKLLSVPQAVLAVAPYKIGRAMPWAKGKDTIPWKAALGDFYRNDEGQTGWQEFADEALGLDPKGGAALGLIADPLWAVGGGTKAVSTAAKAAEAGEDVAKVAKVPKLLEAGPKPVPRYPTYKGEIEVPRKWRKITNVTKKDLRPISEGTVRGPDMAPLFARQGESRLPPFILRRSRPSAPPKAVVPKIVRTKKGTFVGDEYFVALVKKPHRGARQYEVFKLTEPGTLKGAKRFKQTFNGLDEAVEWSRGRLLKADELRSPYAVAAKIVNASAKGNNISKGTFGQLLENVGSLSKDTNKFAKSRVTGDREAYLRLGIGKLSKDIKLKTIKGKELTNAKTAGGLGRSVLERVTHQLKVSNDEMGQVALKFLEGVQKNWEKTLGLSKEEAHLAAQRIGSVGIAANQDPIRAAQLKAAFTQKGLWNEHYDDLLSQFQDHWDSFAKELNMATDKAPGRYFAQSISNESKQAKTDDFLERLKGGLVVGEPSITGARLDPTKARKFESSYAAMTKDQTIDHLTKLGLDREDAAVWAEAWERFAPEASRFADEATGFAPEFDMFKLAKWREQGQMKVLLDRQIREVAAEAGVFDEKVLSQLKSMRPHGPLADSAVGQKLMAFVAVFKMFLTSVNPSHYVRNVAGDYINHLINGNLRHLSMGAVHGKNLYWRIAKGDMEALDEVVKVGGKEYTGAEILVESAMMGLGRGYVGSDIAQMMDILDKGLHNKPFFKQMVNVNMHRENAVRLETYVKHRQAGADMFEAAAKTLRVHFDYSDLSDFEKVIMRNMILFYTWLRKNSMLQVGGLLTRPGLYSAARTMEDYRPKFEGEPDYISKLAQVGLPGVGYWNVGNPMEALHRFDPTSENLNQTIWGAVNPVVRVPIELSTNRSWRTGYDISRGPGDKQPGLAPSLLDALGFNMPRASFTGYTAPAPAMDPKWKYAIENLLLVGPQASTGAALVRPDEEYRPDPGILGTVERVLGIRKDRPDATQAARNVLAKIRDARREVDIRRKYRIGE
jgi:hypothetical protein